MQRRTASSDPVVGRALEYLVDNSAQIISVDELAERLQARASSDWCGWFVSRPGSDPTRFR